MKTLTENQKRFCVEYIVDLNRKEAAIRAGFSERTAYAQAFSMLSDPKIQDYIQELRKEQALRTLVDADYVVKALKEVAERCMQRTPVMVRKGKGFVQKTEFVDHEDGTETEEGVWEFDSMGANKALELLGKHVGIFKDVNPLNLPKGKRIIIEDAVAREAK